MGTASPQREANIAFGRKTSPQNSMVNRRDRAALVAVWQLPIKRSARRAEVVRAEECVQDAEVAGGCRGLEAVFRG